MYKLQQDCKVQQVSIPDIKLKQGELDKIKAIVARAKVVMPLEQAVAHSWAGTTPEAFDAQVRDFIENVKLSFASFVAKHALRDLERNE